MAARLAESLKQLRDEVNSKWPKRSKSSDGWIGDPKHAARKSEHNPDKDNVVRAIDITHDPKGGCDSYALAEFLRQSKDPRILYLISNGRIASPDNQAWAWRRYGGSNPHDHHMHISVRAGRQLYDDRAPWHIATTEMPKVEAKHPDPVPKTIRRASKEEALVKDLQKKLNLTVDGNFGKITEQAVIALQKTHGLNADGIVGPQTWKVLK